MLFLQNKYTTWYFSIVNKAKERITEGYTEKHHIIPRTLGGNNAKSNIVVLTAREHFICHLLLAKMLTGDDRHKMVYALHMLANTRNSNQPSRYKPSSKLYEYERKLFAGVHAERMRQNHPLKNPIHKLSHQLGIERRGPTSLKGRRHKPETIEKLKNKEWSEKALQNRLNNCLKAAEARKGSKWSNDRKEQKFEQYIVKNKHLFPQVFDLADIGVNTRQISLKLKISWDRVKYILDNRDRLNNT